MTLSRRSLNALLAATPFLGVLSTAHAQTGKSARMDSVVLGMVLKPNTLDPTTAAAAAIGEIVHYNVLEGLTKIAMDGAVTPLLTESWARHPMARPTPSSCARA